MINIHTIIFSKDRPAQLDLLIRSIQRFYPIFRPIILVNYSNDNYSHGYSELAERNSVALYIEHSFQNDLINYIIPTNKPFTQFLVDDQICVNNYWQHSEIIERFFEDKDNLCWSPRLGIDSWRFDDGINNRPDLIEYFLEKQEGSWIKWNWHDFDSYFPNCYYSTPMSVDGNIFRSELIAKLVDGADFNGPNQFEAVLERKVRANYYGGYMGALYSPCFVNSPNNRVQDEAKNSYGQSYPMSSDEMNQKYLDGYQLKLEDFEVKAPHTELELKWEKV